MPGNLYRKEQLNKLEKPENWRRISCIFFSEQCCQGRREGALGGPGHPAPSASIVRRIKAAYYGRRPNKANRSSVSTSSRWRHLPFTFSFSLRRRANSLSGELMLIPWSSTYSGGYVPPPSLYLCATCAFREVRLMPCFLVRAGMYSVKD